MKTNHTPGPWSYDEKQGFVWPNLDPENDPQNDIICQTFSKSERDFPNSIANGKLIAAAPDLLAVLIRWQEEWVINGNPAQRANNHSIERQIFEAIKKAVS